MASDLSYMISAINDYYTSDNQIWQKVNLGSASVDEIMYAFSQIPRRQVVVDRSFSGLNLGYAYEDPIYLVRQQSDIHDILGDANSNFDLSDYGTGNSISPRFPGNFGGGGGSDYTVTTGSVSGASGLGSTVMTIADRIGLAVTGINIGCKLGRKIDETIYNIDPEFWDNTYPNINPETWDSIAGSEGGKSFIRTLFGIKDNQLVSYISDDVIAYTYKLLRDNGFFDNGSHLDGQPITVGETMTPQYIKGKFGELFPMLFNMPVDISNPRYNNKAVAYNDGTQICIYTLNTDILPDSIQILTKTGNSYTFAPDASQSWSSFIPDYINNRIINNATGSGGLFHVTNSLETGEIGFILGSPIVNPSSINPGSTQIDPSLITGNTIPEIKQQLKQNYPDLFSDPIHEDVLQPDGSIRTTTYYPVPWSSTATNPTQKTQEQTQPVSNNKTNQQTDEYVDTETATQVLNKPYVSPTDYTTPNVPNTGTGEAPDYTPVTGSASSLWAIYNPSQSEINAFGAWLWDSNFIEQIKKLFNDPMQAIIGVHKVFITPSTGASQHIKCGYIESTVSSKIVTNQYASLDCGTISLPEYFGNVFDYEPYTSVKVFLPFIGIVPLNVADIMRSTINIKYTVDVLTGACIAEIKVKRDGNKSILYTYSGSAIVSYPLSSGSYAGIISGVISTAAGLIGTAMTGGAMLPAALGAVSGIMHSKTNTSVNGQFTGCAGAMGGKTPYLIITRPITRIAEKSNQFSGYPSNYTTKIKDCSGFVKVTDVHLCIDNALRGELEEIDLLLKTGVLTHGIKNEIESIVDNPIQPIYLTQNGKYYAYGDIQGYSPITVDVAPVLGEKNVDTNGVYLASTDGLDGYSKVNVNVTGGGTVILSGDTEPTTEGNNGEIYLQLVNASMLPANYKIVNYISFSNNQYINTGYNCNTSGLRVKAKIEITQITTEAIWGGSWSASGFFLMIYNNKFRWHTGGNVIDTTNVSLGHIYEIETSKNEIIIDGVTYTVSNPGSDSNDNLQIGNVASAQGSKAYMKLYELEIYDGNTLLSKYIPALSDNNIPCLYDMTNNQTKYSQGTNAFGYGNAYLDRDVIAAYAKVNNVWQSLIGTNADDIGGV